MHPADIISRLVEPGTMLDHLPPFAYLLFFLAEIFTPLLYGWNVLEATKDAATDFLHREDNFDFIIGKEW
jgi:hypothetical protein